MVEHLTKSELAIMEVMWDQEDALTATEIIKVSGDKEWKNSSVHLLVNALLEKKFIEVVGFKKTTKNYARTFKPTMTREHMKPEEKMNIYKKLLKEIDDPESLRDIKRNIDARLKVLANQ